MTNKDKILTVARYLEGDMESEERSSFEQELLTDEELQSLVAGYQDLHQTLKMHLAPTETDLAVAGTLKKLNGQYFQEKEAGRTIQIGAYLRWISIAAVLVIGLLIWAPWSASLYEKYGISKEMSVAERGDAEPGDLEKAAEHYNLKEFDKAASLLSGLHQKDPENALVSYYYGVSLIEKGDDNAGRDVLRKLYSGESVFKYDAAYSIGLSYVKSGDKKLAADWLSRVPEESNNYELAKELLTKIK
jgi:hypothetical protein